MATTSLWRVHGWLGKLVVYVDNPDKTGNPKFFEKAGMTDSQVQSLSDVIEYAVSQQKTIRGIGEESDVVMRQFVSGVNVSPVTARDTMMNTKRAFDKTGGVVAYHGYQSFAEGEVTPEQAHEIGVKLAERLWGARYQVLVATHLDKSNHLHNHFIINTVSHIDGKKFHRTKNDYQNMRRESDTLCREYGLSVVENPAPGRSKHHAEVQAEREGRPTWRGAIKAEIDEAISQSMTESQFAANLKKRGYEVKLGKDISVRPPGKERFFRLQRNFGEAYSRQGIMKQMRAQGRPKFPEPEPKRRTAAAKCRGNLKTAPKLTGFRALYYHYLYLLGKLPKQRPRPPAKVHFLYSEDLRKMERISQEVTLLFRHRIDTAEQLAAFKGGRCAGMESLAAQRQGLRNKLRRMKDESGIKDTKGQIALLSLRIRELRKEVGLCDDIAVRSKQIAEKKEAVRQEQQQKQKQNIDRKERNRHEPFR